MIPITYISTIFAIGDRFCGLDCQIHFKLSGKLSGIAAALFVVLAVN
jgi:hypothetical protein